MPSRILYDPEALEILRCQPKPKGSAGLPSKDALCRSAKVPDNQRDRLKTVDIEGDTLTSEAKLRLKLEDNGEGVRVQRRSQEEVQQTLEEREREKGPSKIEQMEARIEELEERLEEAEHVKEE